MSFFGLGPYEILLILAIILILFGPTKLPQLARALGEAVKEFRKASHGEDIERIERGGVVDRKLLEETAAKLGVQSEGKSDEELAKEIIKAAREKGLIGEKRSATKR